MKNSNKLNRILSRNHGEPKKTEHLTIAPSVKSEYDKNMEKLKRSNRKASAQFRLKKKGDIYIPRKDGNKMFEEFVRDCRDRGYLQETKDKVLDEKLRNIYNSAKHLEYDDWLWFINDQYKGRI